MCVLSNVSFRFNKSFSASWNVQKPNNRPRQEEILCGMYNLYWMLWERCPPQAFFFFKVILHRENTFSFTQNVQKLKIFLAPTGARLPPSPSLISPRNPPAHRLFPRGTLTPPPPHHTGDPPYCLWSRFGRKRGPMVRIDTETREKQRVTLRM